ncbi:hypothetical protein Cus16_3144 [Curtobacterium sp. ER1/6]|nr:hypothetical protein Cus16_3144 [Curtobacterium sp. ER1/6]
MHDLRTLGGPRRVTREHDVPASGQRTEARRQRVPRAAAHDDGTVAGDLPEVGEVLGHVPRDPAVGTDHAGRGARPDHTDAADGLGPAGSACPGHQTATAALIAGWCS